VITGTHRKPCVGVAKLGELCDIIAVQRRTENVERLSSSLFGLLCYRLGCLFVIKAGEVA
jgi:hypothetical protein